MNLPLHPPLLRRTAAVVRDRRDVGNVGDLQTAGVERAHGRLATCAANGVLLREPRKPQPPDVAQDSVLPWRSVIVTIVLLKDACTCAIASVTCFLTFLRAGLAPPPAAWPCCCCCF